jgi:putative membrane-bound dehydrogenase-like protein
MKCHLLTLAAVVPITLGILLSANAAEPAGVLPSGSDGKPLNLDFEQGSLKDWTASGDAFVKQPVRGDAVAKRRDDMKSQHQGEYWIGSFENAAGDKAQGTLTSAPFKVEYGWASFLVGGGSLPKTKIELVLKEGESERSVFRASGTDSENLRPIVANLTPYVGKQIFIRVVDQESGPWGHINFDNFRFYDKQPQLANALDARKSTVDMPPPDDVKFAGLTGAQAAKEMTVRPGFSVKLFAGEPDIQQPIAFCIDDWGRLWVTEGYNYPKRAPEGEGKDRILVFEDNDGDGKFDKRHVFMEKLNLVSGLEVGFGGVWIGAAPHLMFVPVKDWKEPKPAGEPKVLLDGWDYLRDTHETLNTFMWGPDGWLYGCHGVFCPSLVGKPGAPEKDRQWVDAAVWRYHPTKHAFEVFAEGTSNPWGIDFDQYGQCFIEACVVPHIWHMIQGARYERQGGEHYSLGLEQTAQNERHRDPKSRKPNYPYFYGHIKTIGDHVHWAGAKGPHAGNARSDAAGGGHAHAGLLIYQGDSWPEEYRGNLFMNNIHGQRINMDIPKRQGSGYVASHGADFINFNDKWSQVLNLLSDQDGSVYMIDWYDKNQCHHNDVNGHDRSNGRIFKVVYNDQKTTKVDLQSKSDEELAQMQLHKNDWYARHARRILQERGPKPAPHAALTKILEQNPDVTRKLRALWTLHATGGLTEKLGLAQLKSEHEHMRAWAVQLLLEDKKLSEPVLNALTELARNDASPLVRLYVASAAQRIPVEKRMPVLEGLFARADDVNDHNLPLMYWYAAEPLVGQDIVAATKLLGKAKIPVLRQFVTQRMSATTPKTAANN